MPTRPVISETVIACGESGEYIQFLTSESGSGVVSPHKPALNVRPALRSCRTNGLEDAIRVWPECLQGLFAATPSKCLAQHTIALPLATEQRN